MPRRLVVLFLLWLAIGLPGFGQGFSAKQTTVTGTVVDGMSGNPIVGATVTLHDAKGMPRTVVVDERRGGFGFGKLEPGVYTLRAARSGFSGGGYAQRTPLGPISTLELAPEEQVNVRLVLWPNPTVRGKVVDAFGDPIAKVSVRAFIQTFVGGHAKLLPHLAAATNDLGEYSVSLVPRTYFIAIPNVGLPAQSRRNEVLDPLISAGYPTTFYPTGSTAATAAALELQAGETRSGIDFVLVKSRALRVAGVVVGFESRKEPIEVRLVPSATGSDTRGLEVARSYTAADGSFEFAMVPPGAYSIRAVAYPTQTQRDVDETVAAFQSGDGSAFAGFRPGNTTALAPTPTGSTLWADVPIRVDEQDLLGVSVRLEQGAHIEGQLIFRGSADRPSDEKLATTPLFILAADGRDLGQFPLTRIQPGGRFVTIGLPPGKYHLSAPLGLGPWRIAAVRGLELDRPIVLGSVDINDLQVTLTDKTTVLSGTARDERGMLQPHAPIYVFPKDKTLWTDFGPWPSRIRRVQASRAARWQVTGLPPGDYYVASTWASIHEAWMHNEVFDRLARLASPISIADGQSRSIDLTVSGR